MRPLRHPHLLVLLALAASLALLAGCGGGDDGGDGDAAPGVTATTGATNGSGGGGGDEDEFVRSGDEICAELQAKAQELSKDAQALGGVSLDNPGTRRAAAGIWKRQTTLVEELDRRFRALGPAPKGKEQLVQDFRDDTAEAVRLAREITTALEGTDDPTSLVQDYARVIDESNATAGLIGFVVCGASG